MTIIAAADGSAIGNPGPAGWGWYVDPEHWGSGGWPHGTNNMGELTAVLELLRATAHLDEDLHILCDSMYVINTVTKWMAGWKRKGWKKADGKPVLNLEIIQGIDEEMAARKSAGRAVKFEWVKGHAGHPLNEAADRLANAASQAYKSGSTPPAGPGFGAPPAPPRAAVAPQQAAARAPQRSEQALFDEPDLFSELELLEDHTPRGPVEEVVAAELALLDDAVRADRHAAAALLHPDWVEVGASGRVWGRDEMLDALAAAGPAASGGSPVRLEVIEATAFSDDHVLLVWRAHSSRGTSLRSSVWLRTGSGWQQRFHQGTREP